MKLIFLTSIALGLVMTGPSLADKASRQEHKAERQERKAGTAGAQGGERTERHGMGKYDRTMMA